MTKHVSAPHGIKLLTEFLPRVAHGRADLGAKPGLVLCGLLAQRATLTRFTIPDARTRVNLGRPAARHHDTGVLLAVGKPALQGYLSDSIPHAARCTPEWDVSTPDITITSHTNRDGQWVIPPDESLTVDGVTDDDPPVWSTEDRISAAWTRILRRALDPDSDVTVEHSTTLATLACIRMFDNSGIGHVDYAPPLGRDGRVSLPDVYQDVPVVTVYVPEERLALSVDTVRDLGEQRIHNPANHLTDLPSVDAPSNGVFEA